MTTWQWKGRGVPEDAANYLEERVRGEPDPATDPDGWHWTMRSHIATSIFQAVRFIGRTLVSRDLQKRMAARTLEVEEWRRQVEVLRAAYNARPQNERNGFVAPREPELGPLPVAREIQATCSVSVDLEGTNSFSVEVWLED